MENRKRIEGVDGVFLLPEAMIQRIQCFLSGKQAAQTSMLSKSWYSAWSTCPKLDFDKRDFRGDENGFFEFVRKTIQRYEESNLKIESFRLWTEGSKRDNSLADKLIKKGMKMGATDLNLEVFYQSALCVLPIEVLESETLINLSVEGYKIELGEGRKIRCSRLKSLSLRRVLTKGDIIWDIISSCPLIEKLVLSKCLFLLSVPTFDPFTRHLTTVSRLSPFDEFTKQNVGSVVDGPVNLNRFDNVKCLFLEMMHIDTSFFHDFASKFPRLKVLSVNDCDGFKGIQISSPSLECITFSFNQNRILRARFVVPSIRKFKFSGSSLPSLSFKTTKDKWKSDISIICDRPSTSWFLKLKEFLSKLSPSEISLSLNIGHFLGKTFEHPRDIRVLPRPALEDLNLLMLDESKLHSALLDGLFWSCRPKFITLCWLPKPQGLETANWDLLQLLCRTLIQEVREDYHIPNRNVFGLCDLEEVDVELLEKSSADWRPFPWKTLFDASTSLENVQKIRFRLRWE